MKRGCAVVMLGWVSWLNVTANNRSETSSIASATETAAQCLNGAAAAASDLVSRTVGDEDQARRYQRLRDTGYAFTRLSPYSFKITSSDGTTKQARFVCLSDTVDPCGPKGK